MRVKCWLKNGETHERHIPSHFSPLPHLSLQLTLSKTIAQIEVCLRCTIDTPLSMMLSEKPMDSHTISRPFCVSLSLMHSVSVVQHTLPLIINVLLKLSTPKIHDDVFKRHPMESSSNQVQAHAIPYHRLLPLL